jgi:hypothetical protein
LLPVLIPAQEVATLPERLPEVVDRRLRRLGIPQSIVQAEVAAMDPITVAATENRSVVGIMVDFAKAIPYYLDAGAWDDSTLPFVEARLAGTPCYAGRRSEEVVFPKRKVSELLCARWVPANTR